MKFIRRLLSMFKKILNKKSESFTNQEKKFAQQSTIFETI